MSFPSGDFANQLNRHDFNEQAALDALRSEGSGKKAKKPPLSASAPASMQSPSSASNKKSVAPEANLRTMLKWVKESPDMHQLDATGAKNLRLLCSSEGKKAQDAETGIFSRFYSSISKERALLHNTIDQTRCKELLTKQALTKEEYAELRQLLAHQTLDQFPKAERKALLHALKNPAFLKQLLTDTKQPQAQKALDNLIKHAYNNGQLYQLFQGLALDNPEHAKAIQQAIEVAMNASIEQSTKKGFLGKLFHSGKPTLTIPLDATRNGLTSDQKAPLDAILGAACAKTILCQRLGYDESDTNRYGKFLGAMIATSAESECKLPIPQSCFEKPFLATQIKRQNTRLDAELQTIHARATKENVSISDLETIMRLKPSDTEWAADACKTRQGALGFDVLGMMNSLLSAKQVEKTAVLSGWKEESTDFTRLENNLKNPSADAKKVIKQGRSLLSQEPSIEHYKQLKACTMKLRIAIEPQYGDLYPQPPTLSTSAPSRIQVQKTAPTVSSAEYKQRLNAELQWIGQNLAWASFQKGSPEQSRLAENNRYLTAGLNDRVMKLEPPHKESSAENLTALKRELDDIHKSIPTPWSMRQVLAAMKVDAKAAPDIHALLKFAEETTEYADRLLAMENATYAICLLLEQMPTSQIVDLLGNLDQLEPLRAQVEKLQQARVYKNMSEAQLLENVLNSLNATVANEFRKRQAELKKPDSTALDTQDNLWLDITIALEISLLPPQKIGKEPLKNNPIMRQELDNHPIAREFLRRRHPERYG